MGETVECPSNGNTSGGYRATPSSGRGPGVIVIQEWWGLVPHIRNVCDRFAADGFVALAPDLFHRKSANLGDPDEAGKLLMDLPLARDSPDLPRSATSLAQD